jgi:hypothetical protein
MAKSATLTTMFGIFLLVQVFAVRFTSLLAFIFLTPETITGA